MENRVKINYKKLWRAWAKSKPLCQCGCKAQIIVSYWSFHRNMVEKGKPPEYIWTHYPKKEKKYWKKYNKWLKSKPICKCGCKKPLKLGYDSFARIIIRFGEPPNFYRDHRTKVFTQKKEPLVVIKEETKRVSKPKEITQTEEICEIEQAAHGRCKRYIQCPTHLSNKCLDITIGKKWMGWRSKKYR